MAAHDVNCKVDLERWIRDFSLIDAEHQRILSISMRETFDGVALAIAANQRLLDAIVSIVDERFVPCAHELGSERLQSAARIGGVINHDKCCGTLRQFAREWSASGALERQSSFGPLLFHLNAAHAGLDAAHRARVRVLVPGSGLGRLMWEVCKCGFSCEGNEFSYHMLLGCSFALNHFARAEEFSIQPWAGGVSNHVTLADRLLQVAVPDEVPALPNEDIRMSMVAGEFCEVYSGMPSMFDVVCTCFFVDTAPDALDYIATIYATLKDGGLWLNHGPLMYHFEGGSDADEWRRPCVYLTHEQLLECVRSKGFDIVHVQASQQPSLYTSAPKSITVHLCTPYLLDLTILSDATLARWRDGRTTRSCLLQLSGGSSSSRRRSVKGLMKGGDHMI
jgi:carnosine N-methyltransferase